MCARLRNETSIRKRSKLMGEKEGRTKKHSQIDASDTEAKDQKHCVETHLQRFIHVCKFRTENVYFFFEGLVRSERTNGRKRVDTFYSIWHLLFVGT